MGTGEDDSKILEIFWPKQCHFGQVSYSGRIIRFWPKFSFFIGIISIFVFWFFISFGCPLGECYIVRVLQQQLLAGGEADPGREGDRHTAVRQTGRLRTNIIRIAPMDKPAN